MRDSTRTVHVGISVDWAPQTCLHSSDTFHQNLETCNIHYIWGWPIWENSKIYVGIAVHKQYSLLDTIFNHNFHLGPPGKYPYLTITNRLPMGRRSRPRIVGFLYFVIDIFLEVQDEKCSWKLYLMDYIAYGPQFPHQF